MKYGLLQSAVIVSHQQKRRRSNYQGTQLFSYADLLLDFHEQPLLEIRFVELSNFFEPQ